MSGVAANEVAADGLAMNSPAVPFGQRGVFCFSILKAVPDWLLPSDRIFRSTDPRRAAMASASRGKRFASLPGSLIWGSGGNLWSKPDAAGPMWRCGPKLA